MATQSHRLLTIPEAHRDLGVGRSTLYNLIAAGELETVKIGSRCLIVGASLEAYVARLRHASPLPASA